MVSNRQWDMSAARRRAAALDRRHHLELAEGRFRVKFFGAEELVGGFEVFDAVAEGIADMYLAGEVYWQDRSPGYTSFMIETIVANMAPQPKADSRIQTANAVPGETTCVSPIGSSSPESAAPTRV